MRHLCGRLAHRHRRQLFDLVGLVPAQPTTHNKSVKRSVFHLALHFVVPALLVGLFYRQHWRVAYLILIATMLVDVDHLLADPIYDPTRCSIGFHPLHQLGFIAFYGLLSAIPRTRLLGLGLIIHMALDAIDCQVTNGIWIN